MTYPNPQEGGKHTPGPWSFEATCFDRRIPIRGGVTAYGRPYTVAWVNRPGSAIAGEDKANARLIAAAPALLEALQAISDMLMGRPDIVAKLHPLMGFAEKATFEKASAALLQATGGENGR